MVGYSQELSLNGTAAGFFAAMKFNSTRVRRNESFIILLGSGS